MPTLPRRAGGGRSPIVWYSRMVRTGSPAWRAKSSTASSVSSPGVGALAVPTTPRRYQLGLLR